MMLNEVVYMRLQDFVKCIVENMRHNHTYSEIVENVVDACVSAVNEAMLEEYPLGSGFSWEVY